MNKGVLFSFAVVLLWALENITIKGILQFWEIQPAIFVCINLMMGAMVLLIISGPGRLGIETVSKPQTWIYSFLRVFQEILFVMALALISATDAALLKRIEIIVVLFLAWTSFGRTPRWFDWAGGAFIIGGWLVVAQGIPPEIQAIVIGIAILRAVSQALQAVISEVHPTTNAARTIKEECRTAGFILMVTSVSLLTFLFGLSAIVESSTSRNDVYGAVISFLPHWEDFFHIPTIWSAMALGVFLTSFYSYFYFVAIKTAKSEVFMSASALIPLFVFFFEYLASLFGYGDTSGITWENLLSAILIGFGALFIIFMRHHRARRLSSVATT